MLSHTGEKGFNVGFALSDLLELEVRIQAFNTTKSWFEFFSIAGNLPQFGEPHYHIDLLFCAFKNLSTLYKKARFSFSK